MMRPGGDGMASGQALYENAGLPRQQATLLPMLGVTLDAVGRQVDRSWGSSSLIPLNPRERAPIWLANVNSTWYR